MNQNEAKKIQELIDRKKFSEVDHLLKNALKSEAPDPDTYYLLGVNAFMGGKIRDASQFLKKCLEIDPKHTDASICLSVLLNDIGQYDEARNIFDKANRSVGIQDSNIVSASVDKKFAVKHQELADLYFRYRRYDEAIQEYTKASQLDPMNIEIRIRKAKVNAKKGYLSRAQQELQTILQDHPNELAARNQLGLLHFSQGNVLDAELEWETVLEYDSQNKDARAYLQMAKEKRSI